MMTIFLFKLRGGQNWVVARGQFWVDVSRSAYFLIFWHLSIY